MSKEYLLLLLLLARHSLSI